MQIVRSTIAANEIRHMIRDNYSDCPHDATCLFEYRGVAPLLGAGSNFAIRPPGPSGSLTIREITKRKVKYV